MSEIKEFKFGTGFDDGRTCPECGKYNHVNEGGSVAADEGTFFYCNYCGKPSITLHNGAHFIAFGKVYQIVGMEDPNQNFIATIEDRLVSPNPFWKPNKTHYQYFQRHHIVEYMNDAYREDL